MVLPWIGGLIVIATIYGIVKRWESRLVLFSAGLLMCILAMNPMESFAAFQKSMTSASLIGPICSVMGFAFVMKLTKCDQHMVHAIAKPVSALGPIIVPAATLATFAVNIALTSAAGCGAAVGAVLIPVLLAAGVHPAMAAAAVLGGTFGSTLSPGGAQINLVAKLANASSMEVVAYQTPSALVAMAISAVGLGVMSFILKENRGYVAEDASTDTAEAFKVNPLMALVPVIPLILLILGTRPQFKSWGMTVPAAMLIGTMLALAVTRTNPAEATKEFFNGMGKGYANVMGIIIAAGVFVAGMNQVGLIKVLLNSMNSFKAAVGAAGTFGPLLISVLAGSGDAATVAFNEAITPHAAQFGTTILDLGTLAALAGALGRTMSPVAGVTIVVSGIAKVNPFEVVKRTAPGMIIAAIVVFLMRGL